MLSLKVYGKPSFVGEVFMADSFFIIQNEKVVGPISSLQLREMAINGKISPSTQVSKSAKGPWVLAQKIKGLPLQGSSDSGDLPNTSISSVNSNNRKPDPLEENSSLVNQPKLKSLSKLPSEEETLLWTGRPSQIVNLSTFILCGLFFWLIIPIFVAIWRWLVIRCTTYEVTSQRFRHSYGVLSRNTDELELYRVKDTAFNQSFFLRIFSLATVAMTTSDVNTKHSLIKAIPSDEARKLRESIRNHVEFLRDKKRVREIDGIN